MNHSPVRSLDEKSPSEVFTGLPCTNALDIIAKEHDLRNGDLDQLDIIAMMSELKESVEAMHKVVIAQREQTTDAHKKRSESRPVPNFSVGDYVLRSRVEEKE